MVTGVAGSRVGHSDGWTAGDRHRLQVAQQVRGGGDQGSSVGAIAGSDNGEASGAGSMIGSWSLAER